MWKGKNILLGVSGSIAAYKIAGLASMLVKQGCHVDVLMTGNATQFISPVTFETLTGTKCLVDTFDRNFQYSVEHISLAKKADVFLVAPASADIIGKLANGIADDMLTTTFLACTCPKLVAPAMNTNMYLNPIVQDNMRKLQQFGIQVITPDSGHLACGDTGIGKMPSEQVLFDYLKKETAMEKDMAGLKVCVTAGPTREALDPVRFLSNHSTGKMGYALAENAMLRGAQVTLVSGPVSLEPVPFTDMIPVTTAEQMFEAVRREAETADIIVKAAAVADYRPSSVSTEKLKKKDDELQISLERTTDILGYLGQHKKAGQFLCGFSMETENMLANSRGKLIRKNLDMIVANNLKVAGAGFGTDTNVITILTAEGEKELPMMNKTEAAGIIFDTILSEIALTNKKPML